MAVAAVGPDRVLEALAETGAIGSTARQLADRLAGSVGHVSEHLDALARDGRVLRIGRGLWILRSFESLEGRSDFAEPSEYTERFARENGIVLGSYDGPITFSSNDDRPVHRWWPYVQGYSAEFVAGLLERDDLPRGSRVLDPFAGSGTTLVEARRAGLSAIGAELLPPAALAARVKTRFEVDPAALRAAAQTALKRARSRSPGPLPFLRETRRHFSRDSLRDLTRLRDALPPGTAPIPEALRVAFGRILIPTSRLRRSPCLGYPPHPGEGGGHPFGRFESAVGEMAEDLAGLGLERSRWGPPAEVMVLDSRALALPPGRVDLAVTSPPYVNGMDYVMNYKLDLAWLGYARSYADLGRLKNASIACDNLPRAAVSAYRSWARAPDPWLPEILQRMEENVTRKGSYRRDDMHGVVHRYFADLRPVLAGVFRALRPGGRFALVLGDSLLAGTYVPGDLIVARLGASLGFRIESVDVARPRRSGQRRSFRLRESIVTLVKPGRAHRRLEG